MKLGNKGFAISTIMYMILILALVITACALAILSSRSNILNKLKESAQNEINNISKGADFICKLKEGNKEYAIGNLYSCDVSNTEEYNFFLLANNEKTVDLIMEDNLIFSTGTYSEDVSVSTLSKVRYSIKETNPKDALLVLKTITDNWFYLDSRKAIIIDGNNTIDYTGYKARLLTFNDIKNYVNDDNLTIDFISDTLTSSIYNNDLIYSISDNKVIIDKKTTDEYSIVPVITVSKEKIKN